MNVLQVVLLALFMSLPTFAREAIEYKSAGKLTTPNRIVSLAPSVTEIIFALGAGEKVKGVTRYCDKPLAAKSLPKVGGFIDPQLEAIFALKPDLVVALPSQGMRVVLDALVQHKVRVVAGFSDSIAEFENLVSFLGRILQKERQANDLLRVFKAELTAIPSIEKPMRVLMLVATAPLVAAGPNTYPDEALGRIGASNALSKKSPSWPTLSKESLLQIAPDVIVVMDGSKAKKHLEDELRGIKTHQNMKKLRIVAAESGLFQRPSFAFVQEMRTLRDLLK